MTAWKPSDVRKMFVVGTTCVCLLLIVLGSVYGVLTGKLSVGALGSISKLGVAGTGLLGLAGILYGIFRISV